MKRFTRIAGIFLSFSLSAGLLMAQTSELDPAKLKPLVQSGASLTVPLLPSNAKSITGSITNINGYVPSTVSILSFTLVWNSPDDDYIDYISMTFPAGITPSAASTIDGAAATVTGQMVTWGTQVSGGSGYGPIDLSPVTFTVTANVGAISGTKTIAYYIESDQYAQTSPWSITANCLVNEFIPPVDLLWDNMIPSTGAIVSSQLRGLYPDSSTAQSGDDFIVPNGYIWNLDSVRVTGSYSTGTIPADSFTVEIWNFTTTPTTLIYTKTLKPLGLSTATSINLDLPDNPVLTAGHYWLSVYAVYNTGTVLSSTRWNWTYGTQSINSSGMIRDETGFFGVPPFNWTTFSGLSVNANSTAFALHGNDTLITIIPDAAIVEILQPDMYVTPSVSTPVEVVIRNFGGSIITSCAVKFSVDGGSPVTATYVGNLAPSASDTFIIGNFTTPTGNSHNLCAWTALINDGNTSNDTLCMVFHEAWNKQFHFMIDTSIVSQAGAESDGFSIFTTVWSGNTLVEYDLQGNQIGTFTIPGVTGIRDLAYDGKYFYGSNSGAYIWKMDFHNRVLMETIPVISGGLVRAIAYDHNADAFWVNNWSTPIELVNRSGVTIRTIAPGAMGSFYGAAYSDLGNDTTYWGFSQDGSGSEIVEIDISTGLQTGLVYDVLRDVPTMDPNGGIAGGLFTQSNVVPGKWSLGGLIQGEAIFCYEIGNASIPVSDVGVHSIDGPGSACGLGSAENIVVTLRNFAYSDISNFPVSYVLDGGTPVTATVTDTLTPGEYKQYTFSAPANFSTGGNHSIVAYTGLSGDQNLKNDTAKASIGNIVASAIPYTMGFEASNDYSSWTVFDENNDGATWQVRRPGPAANTGVGYAQYSYNTNNAGNDWLISTCINMEATKSYKLRFWYAIESATYPEKLKVFVGNTQNPSSMNNLLIDLGTLTNETYQEAAVDFTIPSNGVYYLGFQAYSDPDMYYLYIDDITISDVTGIETPENGLAFSLYPNPAKDLVFLVADADISTVRVINALGQTVLVQNTSGQQHVLDVAHLTQGLYLVSVETSKGIATQRLTIAE